VPAHFFWDFVVSPSWHFPGQFLMSRDDKSATVLFYFTSFLVSRMDDKVPPQLFLARVDQLDGLACELRMGLTNFWSSIS
jgi:hypothetical protein